MMPQISRAEPAADLSRIRAPRIASLDGMRGIAVLLVLLHHLSGFMQGWLGVDIFFVLSGYLITGILLHEREDRHFWKQFYVRRAARIVPAYVVLLVFATLWGRLHWRLLWPYLTFFGANVADWRYQPVMMAAGLNVLWSLAVEEHFYFLWPVQVRKLPRSALVAILLALILLEPVARTAATLLKADWATTYFLTPFRLDGLATGALLAIAMQHPGWRERLKRFVPMALIACAAALALSWPRLEGNVRVLFCNAVAYSLVGITSALLIAHLLFAPRGYAARLLGWRPLVFLGRISYGLYLYHFLVGEIALHLFPAATYAQGLRVRSASMAVSIPLAWVSFRYFESYFLAWGKRTVGAMREEQAVLADASLAAHTQAEPG